MSRSTDELRQLLIERSSPAIDHPAPGDQITARIRASSRRRAKAAVALAAVAVIGVAGVVAVAHRGGSDHEALTGSRTLPARFTASDGATYRRVGIASMAAPAQNSVTIKVDVGSDRVDVMATCEGGGGLDTVADVLVDHAWGDVLFGCSKRPTLRGLVVQPGPSGPPVPPALRGVRPMPKALPVRPGWHEITFTSSLAHKPGAWATWLFGVYEWKPPAKLGPPPPAPRLPESYTGYTGYNAASGHGTALLRRIAVHGGRWPVDRTATFTVPFHGRDLHINAVCSGAIADRLSVTMLHHSPALTCASWSPGDELPDTPVLDGAPGKPITLTFRIRVPDGYDRAAYAKRAASWTIGIYEEQPR